MPPVGRITRKGAELARSQLVPVLGGVERARVVVVLASVLALSSADTATVGSAAIELRRSLHIDNTDIGLLVAVTSVVAAVFSLPFGVLADRVKRTSLLTVAILTWSIAMIWSATVGSFEQLLITRLALGAVSAAAGPAVASLVGDWFPSRERGQIYSYVLTGELLGAGAGFALTGEISALSWRAAFIILALPAIMIAVAVHRLPEPARGGRGVLWPAPGSRPWVAAHRAHAEAARAAAQTDGGQGAAAPPTEAPPGGAPGPGPNGAPWPNGAPGPGGPSRAPGPVGWPAQGPVGAPGPSGAQAPGWVPVPQALPAGTAGTTSTGAGPGPSGAGPLGSPMTEAQRLAMEYGVKPDTALASRATPDMGFIAAVRYVLAVRTNVALIVSGACGYYFLAGVETFGVEFVSGHYHVSQVLSNLLLIVIGGGAVAGVIVAGPLGDRLLRQGRLSGRPLVAAVAASVAVVFLVPAFLTHNALAALPYIVVAAAGLSGQNAPIDSARLDIVPSWLWGRAEGVRTFVRTAAQAIAPLVFGFVSDSILGGGTTGLYWTFVIMLVPLTASAVYLFFAAHHYPVDVATSAAAQHVSPPLA